MTEVEKAYAAKLSQGFKLAREIELAIAGHSERRKQLNWEHVGDLEHVNAKLIEILEFLQRSRLADSLGGKR